MKSNRVLRNQITEKKETRGLKEKDRGQYFHAHGLNKYADGDASFEQKPSTGKRGKKVRQKMIKHTKAQTSAQQQW